MKTRGFENIFLLIVVASFIAWQNPLAAQETTSEQELKAVVREVVEALHELEEKVICLSVDYEANTFNNYPRIFGGGGHIRSSVKESWQVQRNGLGWSRGTSEKLEVDKKGRRRQSELEQKSFYDGSWGVRLTIENNPLSVQRALTAEEVAAIGGLIDSPLELVLAHRGKLLTTLLQEKKIGRVERKELDGRELLILETKPVGTQRYSKSQFWFGKERGYSIVRHVSLSSDSPSGPWQEAYVVETSEHVAVTPRVWLPSKFEVRTYAGTSVALISKGSCSNWSITRPLDKTLLTLELPRSVRFRKLQPEPEKQEVEKLRNFFVVPIKTELQRSLVREGIQAFGAIDVPSLVNVKTKHLELEYFDFEELKKQFRKTSNEIAGPNKSLMLRFDFGSLGTDRTLGSFVTQPIESMAKDSGFEQIRSSRFFHRDALFFKPKSLEANETQEQNLGKQGCDVFRVETGLSKYMVGDFDFVVRINESLALETEELLDQSSVDAIKSAVANFQLDDPAVLLEIRLGNVARFNPDEHPDLPAVRQDSDVQVQAVEQLRSMGFGDVKMSVRIASNITNSFYRK